MMSRDNSVFIETVFHKLKLSHTLTQYLSQKQTKGRRKQAKFLIWEYYVLICAATSTLDLLEHEDQWPRQ